MNFPSLLLVCIVGGVQFLGSEGSGWNSYITNLIAQTKDSDGVPHCDKENPEATIIGLDGGGSWTTAAHANHYDLSASERTTIANAFKSQDFTGLQSNGIVAEGIRYQFLREEDGEVVLGKKAGEGAITLQKSHTAIVIGHVKDGGTQGHVNRGVDAIASYLESLGY